MNNLQEDEKWMRRCLTLARCGRYGAPPNPMVGSVVVHNGRIIGEGYHIRCGTAHAEVNAIGAVKEADRALLKESTLYVNLEPCSHHGRTPPCAELIIRTGIPRVVVGCVDPFAKVEGRGIRMLREAGIDVTVGVLEAACKHLNRRFITFHTHHRPFITLKWARSADGFIDKWREDATEAPAHLSTQHTLMRVHRLRSLHRAILVGHGTLRLDRPTLTVRHWTGENPLPIVLGRVAEGELPTGFEAFCDIDTMLEELYRRGIQTLLVEGGEQTLQTFINRGLWDEAWEEQSHVKLESGVPAPRMPIGTEHSTETLFGVNISHWRNR